MHGELQFCSQINPCSSTRKKGCTLTTFSSTARKTWSLTGCFLKDNQGLSAPVPALAIPPQPAGMESTGTVLTS